MPSPKPVARRIAFLIGVAAVFFFSNRVFFPRVIKFYASFSKGLAPGPGLLFHHALVSCLPQAVLCGLSALLLQKKGLIRNVSFKPSANLAFEGLLWGLAIAGASVPILLLLSMPIGFHPDPWSIAGNVFSNTYEEIIFRWFILYGFWAGTGKRWVGIVVSAIAFGCVHDQYPLVLRTYVGVVGLALSFLATRRNNLIRVIVAHDVADWILDAFF